MLGAALALRIGRFAAVTPSLRWALTVPFAGVPLSDHPDLYRQAEALGYDDLWSSETPNGTDGFTPLALAAPVTERLRLVTGIVNPYTRGPAVLAQIGRLAAGGLPRPVRARARGILGRARWSGSTG